MARTDDEGCSAWNPGVESWIPTDFRALETIFSPECVAITLEEISQAADLTGLPAEELTVYRPSRLALHELIVRVTADIAVAEGEEEREFGENFRRITRCIFETDILPHLAEISAEHGRLLLDANTMAGDILAKSLCAADQEVQPPRRSWLSRLFASAPDRARPRETEESVAERDCRILSEARAAGQAADDPLRRAVFRSLHRILGALIGRYGRIIGEPAKLARLAAHLVANSHGSRKIGERIAPWVETAIERERYSRVVVRPAPVLMSLKGASGAGKSYLRPMLRQTMREQGVEPESYATISPDIWRRLLLDYEALGAARKYAGQLTSRELMAIDRKLDHYIQFKANRDNAMPHLVVDRFRFDSFSSDQVKRVLHNTYVRHVDTLAMYFIVTPPEETVERGWSRALERGRYKSVEDYLAHAVEAYVGMPNIFFRWLDHAHPVFRYQFLDNLVAKGSYPKMIAQGGQAEITIVDPLGLINIERYQKVNIHATRPDEVYPPTADMAVARNAGFLKEIVRRIARVNFVTAEGASPYLVAERGVFRVADAAQLAEIMTAPDLAAVFSEIAPRRADDGPRVHPARQPSLP
jgi:thymidylate kinase